MVAEAERLLEAKVGPNEDALRLILQTVVEGYERQQPHQQISALWRAVGKMGGDGQPDWPDLPANKPLLPLLNFMSTSVDDFITRTDPNRSADAFQWSAECCARSQMWDGACASFLSAAKIRTRNLGGETAFPDMQDQKSVGQHLKAGSLYVEAILAHVKTHGSLRAATSLGLTEDRQVNDEFIPKAIDAMFRHHGVDPLTLEPMTGAFRLTITPSGETRVVLMQLSRACRRISAALHAAGDLDESSHYRRYERRFTAYSQLCNGLIVGPLRALLHWGQGNGFPWAISGILLLLFGLFPFLYRSSGEIQYVEAFIFAWRVALLSPQEDILDDAGGLAALIAVEQTIAFFALGLTLSWLSDRFSVP
jgi:hypothetical protein